MHVMHVTAYNYINGREDFVSLRCVALRAVQIILRIATQMVPGLAVSPVSQGRGLALRQGSQLI